MNTIKMFNLCLCMSFIGYGTLLIISFTNTSNVLFLLIPAFFIMASLGVLNVIITIFLANTVDYGELKNNRRDESVIFSMQTFVYKLASGIAALVASIVLTLAHIDSKAEIIKAISMSSRMTLRMSMTLIPIFVLIIGFIVFNKRYKLTDTKLDEISLQLKERHND